MAQAPHDDSGARIRQLEEELKRKDEENQRKDEELQKRDQENQRLLNEIQHLRSQGKTHSNLGQEHVPEDSSALDDDRPERAFKTTFIHKHHLVDHLVEYIAAGRLEWSLSHLYAPFGAVVQSSMSGKSRLLMEMASAGDHVDDTSKNEYVFYIGLMRPDTTGFPKSYPCVRDFFSTASDALARHTSFLFACLERLGAYTGNSSKEWLASQDLSFWDRVVARANELFDDEYERFFQAAGKNPTANKRGSAQGDTACAGYQGTDSESGGGDSLSGSMLDATEGLSQPGQGEAPGAAARQSSDDADPSKGTINVLAARFQELLPSNRNVLFVFDEAGNLFDDVDTKEWFDYTSPRAARFVALRRALSYFPHVKRAPFALMTDTTSRICNLCPVPHLGGSARIASGGWKLYEPFYLVVNVDVFAVMDGPPRTMRDVSDWRFYFRYGRPQWGAYLTTKEGLDQFIMPLVRSKILGGDSMREAAWPKTSTEAMAILGIRACIDVNPQCLDAHNLVARHMRSVFHISDDRKSVVTGYFSEPALVQGAAQLLNGNESKPSKPGGAEGAGAAADARDSAETRAQRLWDDRAVKFRSLLSKVQDGLTKGQVENGFRGELVARLLLLMGWDMACLSMLKHEESPYDSGVFLRPVLVKDFLDCVFNTIGLHGYEDWQQPLDSMWVRCTHFIKGMDYVPDKTQLLELFRRGAALIGKDCQPGVDIIIPTYSCKMFTEELTIENISVILVQCKNIKGPGRSVDGSFPLSATSLLTPEACGIKDISLPFVSLYMSMGTTKDHALEVLEPPRAATVQRRGAPPQLSIAAFGLSPAVYRVMDAEMEPLLKSIGTNQCDPLRYFQNDGERQLVRLLSPGQYQSVADAPSPASG
eukprot:CAMPEP_0113724070 /NCGR_PEP_ID=MMETSP0038_2-20120614/38837_1 /TAXON_ID=2898 /ORGANISM="Cryptomonas paramecium" /LENGTH=875 /DNA_ID=CAMNT_0000653855 /DNA_START=107 /DNA_END=2731 /DNA_ORIENTATION=+ /assembly_acc=CAM_ASM_000170